MLENTPLLPPDLEQRVHKALKHWHSEDRSDGLLDDLLLYRYAARSGPLHPRQISSLVLQQAVDSLTKKYPKDAALLAMRYREKWHVEETAHAVCLAESTVYAKQHVAIRRLASVLGSMESAAWRARVDEVNARLEPRTSAEAVGVAELVEALLPAVCAPEAPWIVSIEGIGGSGKTRLADALVRKLGQTRAFDHFGWVSSKAQELDLEGNVQLRTNAALRSHMVVKALVQQLMPEATGELLASNDEAIAALRRQLKSCPHLIVMDSLDTVTDLDSFLPSLMTLTNPSKLVLTSRKRLVDEKGIFYYQVPELDARQALTLIRREAKVTNNAALMAAGDDDLCTIYQAVGGNPLALLLVNGLTREHSLDAVLHDLQSTGNKSAGHLFVHIFRDFWDSLDDLSRDILLAMPMLTLDGGDAEDVATASKLPLEKVRIALRYLVALNLVDVSGDLHNRRYSIRNLTRSFLREEAAQWM